jgi:uncharacterized protein YraI
MSKLVRCLALTALAFALLVPAAAHAQGFEVSRDIGVYAGATTKSKGIGTIRAHQLAQVECWTTGQPVLGYAIWDRVKYRGLTGYVNDKYVELGGSHKYPTLDHGLILLDATEFRLGEPEPTGDGTKVVYNPRLLACAPGRFAGPCVT